MVIVYKIPTQLKPEVLKGLVGAQGTIPNPVQDKNGNWVISRELWENGEFDEVKKAYPQMLIGFELIEWVGQALPEGLNK